MNWILAATTGALFGVGVYHMLQRDAVRLVLGYSLVLGAANLFLLACGTREGTAAPYVPAGEAAVDPLPQVLVLTALVIGFGVLAWLAVLVLAAAARFGSADADAWRDLRG
ncbi:sodium:proton antiporter [Myxococcota bacterium]|nr:sodium:proton antiporter [Myxococcota bacterium]